MADTHQRELRLSVGSRLEAMTERGVVVALAVAVFSLYLFSATHSGTLSVDIASAMAAAWKIASAGTLDLSSYHGALLDALRQYGQAVEVNGAIYSDRNPGLIAYGVPFYALARLVTPDAVLPLWPQALAASASASASVVLVYLALSRLARRSAALGASLLYGFGTGTWSVSADGLWGHGPTQMFLALGLFMLARERRSLAGLSFGAALTIRPYSGFAAAAIGVHEAMVRRSVKPALAIGITSAVGLAAFILYTRVVFGIWSLYGGYSHRAYLERNVEGGQGLLELPTDLLWSLIHPDQGLLLYSPFLLLLIVGLPAGWRNAPTWVRSAFLGGIAFFVAQLYVNSWNAGAYFFGYRYPLELLTLSAPMGLLAYEHGVRGRPVLARLFPYAAVASIALHFAGAVLEPYK